MRQFKHLLIATALLSAGALAITPIVAQPATVSAATTQTKGDGVVTPAKGVVYIARSGGANTYSDPASLTSVNGHLAFGSAWRYSAILNSPTTGVTAYKVSGTQWVATIDVSNAPTATGKITAQQKSGKLYLSYYNDGIATYKDPEMKQINTGYAQLTFIPMPMGENGVAYDRIAVNTMGQTTAYHLAQGWVPAGGYFYEENPAVYTVEKGAGTVIVGTKGAPIYTDQTLTKTTGRTLAAGSQWQYFSYLKGQQSGVFTSQNAYNLGGNQWVARRDVTAYANGVRINSNIFTVNYPAHPTWSVAKYQFVNGQMKAVGLLPAKSQWKTFQDRIVGGKIYHSLGGNQWVLASTGTLKYNY